MSHILSTSPGRPDNPPGLQPTPERSRTEPEQNERPGDERPRTERGHRRVGPIDRLALHLGVALIKWGRRPGGVRSSRSLSESDWEEILLARDERVHAIERQREAMLVHRLTIPYR